MDGYRGDLTRSPSTQLHAHRHDRAPKRRARPAPGWEALSQRRPGRRVVRARLDDDRPPDPDCTGASHAVQDEWWARSSPFGRWD